MPKYSIITICYNEPSLEDTCKTIINQTYQDFEWIVIDGGSKQETLDIFNKYKSRIDYFVSEPDKGRYNAMNKGIMQAKGDYLIFMNAGDCFYESTTLEKCSEKIQNNNIDVYYGNGYFKRDDKLFIGKMPVPVTKYDLYINSLFHQAMFFKRELFECFGLYDESFKIVADWKFYFNLLNKGCSFEWLDLKIAVDDGGGISNTQKELTQEERTRGLRELFTTDELKTFRDKVIEKQKQYKEIQNLMKNRVKLLKAKRS